MNHFSQYPYQNYQDYNLDWLMRLVKEVNKKLSVYLETSVIKFADPITWDITDQYTALTCVVDKDGTAYLSKQPVPAGIDITNTNYWLPIFNYDDNINKLLSNITVNTRTTGVLPETRAAGSLAWYNGDLYMITSALPAGAVIIPDTNAEKITLEQWADIIRGLITQETNDRINADTALGNRIDGEITNRQNADTALGSRIDDEITNRQNADTALGSRIDDEITNRQNADTTLGLRISNIEAEIGSVYGNVVMIGDSYGHASGQGFGWIDKLIPKMGLDSSHVFESGVGGAAFNTAAISRFVTQLALLAANMTTEQRAAVGKVICCGGANERGWDAPDIVTFVTEFCNQSKILFPNAKIYIGMNAGCIDNNFQCGQAPRITQGYKEGCTRNGAIFLENVQYCMHTREYLAPNNLVHMTEAGYSIMADAIYSALYGGYTFSYHNQNNIITPPTGATGADVTFEQDIENNLASFSTNMYLNYTFASPQNVSYEHEVMFGTIPNKAILGANNSGYNYNRTMQQVTATLTYNNTYLIKVNGTVKIDDVGNLYFRNNDPVASGSTSGLNAAQSIQLSPFRITIPSIGC